MKTFTEDLVSIIMPYYNRKDTVKRTINSVVRQTYRNWELLIVDDCSDIPFELDKTLIQVQNRVELYRNNVNSGPGISRQVGMDNACGVYICFLDSDDFYNEDFLVKMVRKLRENKECSGAYCTSFNVVENEVRRSSNVSFNKIMPTLFHNHRPWATCSWLWRRECLPNWTNERSNEDSLFEINVAMNNNKIVHVNDVLCYIDKGTGSNTIDLLGSRKNELDRNNVVQYCLHNLSNFKSDEKEIIECCLKRILYTSARLIKLGELRIVEENIIVLRRCKVDSERFKSVWLLQFGVFLSHFSKSLGFKFLEFNRGKSIIRFT